MLTKTVPLPPYLVLMNISTLKHSITLKGDCDHLQHCILLCDPLCIPEFKFWYPKGIIPQVLPSAKIEDEKHYTPQSCNGAKMSRRDKNQVKGIRICHINICHFDISTILS